MGRTGVDAPLFTQEPAADQLIEVMPRHGVLLIDRARYLLHVQRPTVIRLRDLFKDPVLDGVRQVVRRFGTPPRSFSESSTPPISIRPARSRRIAHRW